MCRFFTNKLWQVQEGLLPRTKIVPTYPFQFVGVDIAGPLFKLVENPVDRVLGTKEPTTGKRKKLTAEEFKAIKVKYYVLVIVCANTRAVELQLVTSLSAASILQAFECFVAVRGRPSFVLSDNADNFTKTSKVLKQSLHDVVSRNYAETKWVFIPTYSPWWGGQYEIFVKLIKSFSS